MSETTETRANVLAALRAEIRDRVRAYHEVAFARGPFRPGEDVVPVSGKVFDAEELELLVDASLDFWLTAGRYARQFEREFARTMSIRECVLVNSGSSANLLAVSALTSPTLGERALRAGDEIITVAAGFPTTVNPIVQNGLVPVFIDVLLPTYNVDVTQLDAALSSRSKGVMIAHTLGNPFDLDTVTAFAKRHGLWLIEDCCDAVGASFGGKPVGTWGDLATVSFYPAHHITMGEGGAVLTAKPAMRTLLESFRDWGRDCWCEPGKDNTCGKRFGWEFGQLPPGYDHKYTYSHRGYNLKVTDMQAAIGVAQLKKLGGFIEARRRNWSYLRERLLPLEDQLILPEPTPGAEPSWFGFPITVRKDAAVSRNALVKALEANRVATRLLFGGNLVRQPAYRDVTYRAIGDLPVADTIMHQTFWIGIYPGLTEAHLDYAAVVIGRTLRSD